MRRVRSLIALCLAAAPVALEAQGILVAPHAIFIDHRTRTGSLELYNPNAQPAEVSITTIFGHPVTDAVGNLTLKTSESPDSAQPSAAAWIEAYPRRLVLRPFERQRVRLLARPPASLPDGEYWTRLVIAAKGASLPVAGALDTTSIRIGLTVEMRTIIALFYRKGPLRTGVALSDVRGEIVGDSLFVRARLTREGNAAYLGMLRGKLIDREGKQVATFASQLGVYYSLEPRFTAAVGSLAMAPYTVQVEVATDRDDLPRNGPIRASPVRGSAAVTVARRSP